LASGSPIQQLSRGESTSRPKILIRCTSQGTCARSVSNRASASSAPSHPAARCSCPSGKGMHSKRAAAIGTSQAPDTGVGVKGQSPESPGSDPGVGVKGLTPVLEQRGGSEVGVGDGGDDLAELKQAQVAARRADQLQAQATRQRQAERGAA